MNIIFDKWARATGELLKLDNIKKDLDNVERNTLISCCKRLLVRVGYPEDILGAVEEFLKEEFNIRNIQEEE